MNNQGKKAKAWDCCRRWGRNLWRTMEFVNVPCNITIVARQDVKAYTDSAATQAVVQFFLGTEIHRGDTFNVDMWLKNHGDIQETLNVALSGVTGITMTDVSPYVIDPTQVVQVTMQFTVAGDCPFGEQNFNVVVTG